MAPSGRVVVTWTRSGTVDGKAFGIEVRNGVADRNKFLREGVLGRDDVVRTGLSLR